MRYPLLMIFFLASGLLSQRGLQAQAVLKPSLGVSFPVKEDKTGLVLTSGVLINMNDLLPAGTVLHKLFPKPKKDDKDVKTRKIKVYDTGKYQVKQRLAIENLENDLDKSAMIKAVEDRAGGDAMTSELKFRAMLHRMNIEDYYLAYDLPGAKERRIGQFDYPEGLFLSEQNGKIIVLSVVDESLAQKIGVEPGSRITAMNGKDLLSLDDFRARYFTEKEGKKAAGGTLSMSVVPPGQTEARELEFKVRRSLNNTDDIMSDFNSDTDKKGGSPERVLPQTQKPPKPTPDPDEVVIPLIP